MSLVLESVFKTFPMRRRSLKARVYITFRIPFRLAAVKVYSAAEECGLKLLARGWDARLSASRLVDENDMMRTVHGWLKYTLALILICACEKCCAEVK